jgi:hypothetical protein
MSDPYASNVILLLSGDDFIDQSPADLPVSSYGATIDTTNKKYGYGALNFPFVYGEYILVKNTSLFDFSISTDFTIELHWKRLGAGGVYGCLMSSSSAAWGGFAVGLFYDHTNIAFTTPTGTLVSTAHGSSTNYVHIALTRSGNTFRLFLDGVKKSEYTVSPFININFVDNYRDGVRFGRNGWDVGTNGAVQGCMDNIRVTRGVARYTEDFTPPGDFFNTTYGAFSGRVYKSSGGVYVPGAYSVRAYNRATGALSASTTSDSNGDYVLDGLVASNLSVSYLYDVIARDEADTTDATAIAESKAPT